MCQFGFRKFTRFGPFSAVSAPLFVSEYSSFSIDEIYRIIYYELKLKTFAKCSIISPNVGESSRILQIEFRLIKINVFFFAGKLLMLLVWSNAEVFDSCRSRIMSHHEYLTWKNWLRCSKERTVSIERALCAAGSTQVVTQQAGLKFLQCVFTIRLAF